jgi:hypothetical protein
MNLDLNRSLGLNPDGTSVTGEREQFVRYIHLKLAALGVSTGPAGDGTFLDVAHDLLAQHREYRRLLDDYLCPADQRIQGYLDAHLAGEALSGPVRLPTNTFSVDRHGLARELSLPAGADAYKTDLLESYRIRQGVLHNPRSDRRTTQGVFHVAEGGLPIPADKVTVPKHVYGNLLAAALNPPADLLRLPFTARVAAPAELFCTLLLRPVVCPAVPGFCSEKTMEVRFFAPGALVSNLDFVESIFGNAGDPYLPENDAGLDVEHWTGHTGCVILAPHLPQLRKKDLGLPHWDHATDRQREQGMCWRAPDERYNDGRAFKVTSRTDAGVMVTLIADNYFGYCKKEVKTQISYAANLFGLAEEEHAGGAVAFASYSLGDVFRMDPKIEAAGYRFDDVVQRFGSMMDVQPEGYGVDKSFPDVIYVPEDVYMDAAAQRATWVRDGVERSIKLLPGKVYVHPAGYKVRLEKHPGAPSWRLVGTEAEGTFCHKPCTVSGGGKSEISKSITDAVQYGPIFVADLEKDLDEVERLFDRDYSDRLLPELRQDYSKVPSRPILSPARSLGSVIKLLTPSPGEYTDEFNAWLETIPDRIRALVFIIKRFYRAEWGNRWRQFFSVEEVNGAPAHSLKFGSRKLVGSYLRVGLSEDGNWRMYKLRQDYIASDKVQMEDDITASVTVPAGALPHRSPAYDNPSLKVTKNCEYRLFQRPDEAIHPGFDAQTEWDMAQPGLFASNYAPLTPRQAREVTEDVMEFEKFRPAMRANVEAAARMPDGYVVCSAHPRVVDGKRTKNPRYLQVRPDIARPRDRYVAEIGVRLRRRIPLDRPVVFPVNAVLSGRRNNPAGDGIRPLAVYNPIHYQGLPELFMDYVCSLTGKSPSTTGAGSEGALTKGPFNALPPAADLNNALVSFILTGYDGFSTAAGYVGPHVRVDHDISLLIPEIWARLPVAHRDPRFLIEHGHLEKIDDFVHDGKPVLASRLGFRITAKFVHTFFGKVFDSPSRVFSDHILRPESQDLASFVDGVRNITEAQRRVALGYFEDGGIESACPPLQALLHIMAHGSYEGMTVDDPRVRRMFTREHLLVSEWYRQRLETKQRRDVALWRRHVEYLERFLKRPGHRDVAAELGVADRLTMARAEFQRVRRAEYIEELVGTIGADPIVAVAAGPTAVGRRAELTPVSRG